LAVEILVSPSILSCDFARLGEEVLAVDQAGADWVHVDVMDGHFVDNLTIGPPVVASLKKITKSPLDVHLMIEKPDKSIDQYIKAGADLLTIHVESTIAVGDTLKRIRSSGVKPGITMRPQTSVYEIEKYLELVDLVLIMTVNPGWSGQSFMLDQVEKIKFIKSWAYKNNPDLFVEVDGGINPETAKICRDAGANVFVAGNAVFKSGDYKKAISDIKGL
jgi:ribulose-phosphate 3-epimerase